MARTEIDLGTDYPHVRHYRFNASEATGAHNEDADAWIRMKAAPFQIVEFSDGRLILPICQRRGTLPADVPANTDLRLVEPKWHTYNLAPGASTWTSSTTPEMSGNDPDHFNIWFTGTVAQTGGGDLAPARVWQYWASAIWGLTPPPPSTTGTEDGLSIISAHRAQPADVSSTHLKRTFFYQPSSTTNINSGFNGEYVMSWGARSYHAGFHLNTPIPISAQSRPTAMDWVFTRRSNGDLMAQTTTRSWHSVVNAMPTLEHTYAEHPNEGWNFRNDWQHIGDGITPRVSPPQFISHYIVSHFQIDEDNEQDTGANSSVWPVLNFTHMRERQTGGPLRVETRNTWVGVYVDEDGKAVFDCVWNGDQLFQILTTNDGGSIVYMLSSPGLGDIFVSNNLPGGLSSTPTGMPGGVRVDELRVGYHDATNTYVIVAVTEGTDSSNRPHIYWHTLHRSSTGWETPTDWVQVDTTDWGTDWPSSSVWVTRFIRGGKFYLGVTRHSSTTDPVDTEAFYVYDLQIDGSNPTVGWADTPTTQLTGQGLTLKVTTADTDVGASIDRYRMLKTTFNTAGTAVATYRLSGTAWTGDTTPFEQITGTIGAATAPITTALAAGDGATQVPWIDVGTTAILGTLGGTATLPFHNDFDDWSAANESKHRYFFQVADNDSMQSEWATIDIIPLGPPTVTITAPAEGALYDDPDTEISVTYTVTFADDTIPSGASPKRRVSLLDSLSNIIWSEENTIAATEFSDTGYTWQHRVGDNSTDISEGSYTIQVRASITDSTHTTVTVGFTVTQPTLNPPIVTAGPDPDGNPAIAASVVNLTPYSYSTFTPVVCNRYTLTKTDVSRSDYYFPSDLPTDATLPSGSAVTSLDWATRAHSDYAYFATGRRVSDTGTRSIAAPSTDFMVDLFRSAEDAGATTPAGRVRPATGRLGGAFWDVDWLHSVWADQQRTIPAVVNGPVAVVDDLSGNGNHLRFFPFMGQTPRLRRLEVPSHSGMVRYYVEHTAGGYVPRLQTGPEGELFLYYAGSATAHLFAVLDLATNSNDNTLNIPTGSPPTARAGETTLSMGDFYYVTASLQQRITYINRNGVAVDWPDAGTLPSDCVDYFADFVTEPSDPVGWALSASLQDHTYTIGPYNMGQNGTVETADNWLYRNATGSDPVTFDWFHFGGVGWLNTTLRQSAAGQAVAGFRARFFTGLLVADTRDIDLDEPHYGGINEEEVRCVNLILSHRVTPFIQQKPPDFGIDVPIGDASYASHI